MDKNEMVKNYILGVRSNLIDSIDFNIPDSVIDALINKYDNYDLPYDDLVSAINADVEMFLDEAVKEDKDYSTETLTREEEQKKIEEMAKEEELEEKNDITLNDSDINLMMIANAKTPKQLQDVINRIPNLNINLKSNKMDDVEFGMVKSMLFEQYRDSIPQSLRDIGNLNLVTMEDYENLSNDISNDYDSVTIDNGNGLVISYDTDKDFNIEDHKYDNDLSNKNDIDMNEKFDSNYVEARDPDYEKETFDVEKKEIAEDRDAEINSMMPNEEVEEKEETLEKENHKVLKIVPPDGLNSEKGNTDTINVMLTIASFVSIMILLILCTLIKG